MMHQVYIDDKIASDEDSATLIAFVRENCRESDKPIRHYTFRYAERQFLKDQHQDGHK